MNRFSRALASFRGKIILPVGTILVPTAPEGMGYLPLTLNEAETIIMSRARVSWLADGPAKGEKFEESAKFRNARLALRDAVNGTDPKNG